MPSRRSLLEKMSTWRREGSCEGISINTIRESRILCGISRRTGSFFKSFGITCPIIARRYLLHGEMAAWSGSEHALLLSRFYSPAKHQYQDGLKQILEGSKLIWTIDDRSIKESFSMMTRFSDMKQMPGSETGLFSAVSSASWRPKSLTFVSLIV